MSSVYTFGHVCDVGRFNLDPNRVLDIILEAFECQANETEFFLSLLKEYDFDGDTVCQMVGFKFKFYRVRQTLTLQTVLIGCNTLIDSTEFLSVLVIPRIVNPRCRETGFRPSTDVTKMLPVVCTVCQLRWTHFHMLGNHPFKHFANCQECIPIALCV